MLYIILMSEYANGNSATKEQVHESHFQDTLFDLEESQSMSLVDEPLVEEYAFRDDEPRPELQYSRTVLEWQHELLGRDKDREAHTEREDTPHEEYGGGLRAKLHELVVPTEHPLEAILRGYKPYQWEVAMAINQFSIAELTPPLIDDMPKRDKNLFACHFEQFLEVLKSRPRILDSFEGEIHSHPTLYRQYGDTSPSELIEYAETLRSLRLYLRSSGIAERLLQVAHDLKGTTKSRELYVKNDRRNNGPIHVVFKETQLGQRQPRVVHAERPIDQQ